MAEPADETARKLGVSEDTVEVLRAQWVAFAAKFAAPVDFAALEREGLIKHRHGNWYFVQKGNITQLPDAFAIKVQELHFKRRGVLVQLASEEDIADVAENLLKVVGRIPSVH